MDHRHESYHGMCPSSSSRTYHRASFNTDGAGTHFIYLPHTFHVTSNLCAIGLLMLSGMFDAFSTVYKYSPVYVQ